MDPGVATFRSTVTPEGIALVWRDQSRDWPSHLSVSRDLIERADPEFLAYGDGMLRFTPRGESALYGFAHEDPLHEDVPHFDLIRVED